MTLQMHEYPSLFDPEAKAATLSVSQGDSAAAAEPIPAAPLPTAHRLIGPSASSRRPRSYPGDRLRFPGRDMVCQRRGWPVRRSLSSNGYSSSRGRGGTG